MSQDPSAASRAVHELRLAKVLGVLAVTASAVAAKYGAGINFASTQSLAVYPAFAALFRWRCRHRDHGAASHLPVR